METVKGNREALKNDEAVLKRDNEALLGDKKSECFVGRLAAVREHLVALNNLIPINMTNEMNGVLGHLCAYTG